MKFRIMWRSKLTEMTGHGEYLMHKETTEIIARDLNKKIPELDHWVEPQCVICDPLDGASKYYGK